MIRTYESCKNGASIGASEQYKIYKAEKLSADKRLNDKPRLNQALNNIAVRMKCVRIIEVPQ